MRERDRIQHQKHDFLIHLAMMRADPIYIACGRGSVFMKVVQKNVLYVQFLLTGRKCFATRSPGLNWHQSRRSLSFKMGSPGILLRQKRAPTESFPGVSRGV